MFGYDLANYDALFEEKIALLLQLNAAERVTWQGRFRPALHDAPIPPRPLQHRLPIWIGKRLEILKNAAPQISRIAILWDSSNPGMAQRVRETEIAADQAHILLRTVGPRNLDELEAAFLELSRQQPDALLVTTEPYTRLHQGRILDFANSNRLPAMYEDATLVEAGGLMSYGPDYRAVFRRAAVLIDKILKGAKPGDIPIEQPTTFDLVINLKTANTIGLNLPASVLARADKLIERTPSPDPARR